MNLGRLLRLKDKPVDDRVTWREVVAALPSPTLRLFGAINVAAALFYGGLGTYGILRVMFGAEALPFAIGDMIQLLERSLSHSAVGGAALITDYVVTRLGAIAQMRRTETTQK